MVTKVFDIALDLKRPPSNREFELVEGDTGNQFRVALTDDGNEVNLDNCRVVAVFAKSGGTTMQDSQTEGNGVSVAGNVITIDLRKESYGVGTTECELQVYSGELQDTLVTTARFNFSARKAFFNEDTAQSTNEYPILVQLIADANEAAKNATDAAALVEESASKATQAVTDAEAAVEAAGNLSAEVTAAEAERDAKVAEVYAAYNSGELKGDKGDKGDTGAAGMDGKDGKDGKVQSVDNVQPNSNGTLTLSAVRYASQTLTMNQQEQARKNINAAPSSSYINAQDDGYSLTLSDAGKLVLINSETDCTVSIPAAIDFPIGTEIEVAQMGAGVVNIFAFGADILSMDGMTSTAGQYAVVCLKKLDETHWLLGGGLA